MATATYIPTRRVILTALTRVFGSRSLVIVLTLGVGAVLFGWARYELAAMFERNETGEIVFGVAEADPGCVAPSLYLMPDGDRAGSYFAVIDMLGGGIADPGIMNIGRPSVALSAGTDPREAPRATAADCAHMAFRLPGRLTPVTTGPDSERTNATVSAAATASAEGDASIVRFALAAGADDAAARSAYRLDGIDDLWQFGIRRLNLWNSGRLPVNVFLLDAPGYAFLSDTFDPLKPPVRGRSVAALALTRPNLDGTNAFQAYSRLIDYDARLQSRLLTVSTVFGIGISLLVEGFILAALRIARWFRGKDDPAREDEEGPGVDG